MACAATRTGPLAVALVVTACGGEAAHLDVVRRDSAGVALVDDSPTDVPLPWRFQTDFTLGGRDEGPEAWRSLGSASVGVDGEGRLYVLDGDAHHVVVYDDRGALLRVMGGEGEGPGELRMTSGMAVSPEGEAWVLDFGKGGFVRYGPDGTVLSERRPLVPPMPNRQRAFAVSGDVLTASTIAPRADGERGYWNVLREFGAGDSVDILTNETLPAREVSMAECGGAFRLPPLFAPEVVWDRRGREVAVSHTADYAVSVYDDTTLVRVVRRDLPVRAATEALALQEVGEGMRVDFGRGPCLVPGARIVQQQGWAPQVPWVGSLALAPDGRLWVQRRAIGRGAVGLIDVFGADGAYTGTLPEGTPFPVAFMPDGRVVVIRTDSLDVPSLLVRRVIPD
jgi:6-bladed beta-propeller